MATARLFVDDAGVFLVVAPPGEGGVSLGSGGEADVPFGLDLAPIHARMHLTMGLRTGPVWTLHPEPGCAVRQHDGGGSASSPAQVSAQGPIPLTGSRIFFGDDLELAGHLPDPASASLLLVASHPSREARRILMLAPGEEGRVRIGPGVRRHLRVPGLGGEITMQYGADDLVFTSSHGGSQRILLPPLERSVIDFPGMRPSGSPPFGVTVEPVSSP